MKIFKIILILLLSLLGIVIIGGGILVILVYDNSYKENPYQDYNNDLDYEVNSLISNAIKDTKETKMVDASIDEERINYLLQALINTLNKEFGNEVNIKGANVEIKENDSTLISIHFNVLGFPSSLKGDFTLKDDNNTIYFQINNASIGKINASRNTMGSLAALFIRDKEIQKDLEKKGIKIDVNVHQLKVSLNKDDVPGMINEMMKDDPNNELYAALVDIVFENELIKIIATNHELGADANLTKLAYDSTKFYDIPYNFDYEDIKSKTEQLLNNNIIDYKNCGLVFDYLVRGYERVTKKDEENKYGFIKDLNLTSIGIYSNTTYDGILEMPKRSMLEILTTQAPSILDLLSPSIDFKIYEADFNTILFNTNVVGISYAFAREENNQYKVSYLYVESLYTNITDDKLEIIITLNINGYSIALKCTSNASGSDGLAISTDVSAVDLGEISLTDDQIKAILNYLNTALAEEEWINTDSANKRINFNFVKLFSSNETLELLVNKASSTSCGLYSNGDNGYLKISLSGLI